MHRQLRRRTLVGLAFASGLLTTALGAQQPGDRRLLQRLDEAITPGLLPEIAQGHDPVTRDMQTGYTDLAAWVRGDDGGALERALFRFNAASAKRTAWGWPEYALAHALVLMHFQGLPQRPSAGIREGEAYLEAAMRHLDVALRRDPDLEPARKLLVEITLPSGDRELRADTRVAIEREVRRADPLPGALVVWARDLRRLGGYDSALVTFDRARDLGFDGSIIALERARTLAALHDLTGAEHAYWRGLPGLSDAARAVYRQDLGYFLLPDSLAIFDSLATREVEPWLTRFWAERDAAIAEPPGTRLREHLRRWVFAFAHYRVTRPWRTNVFTRVDMAFDNILDSCTGSVPEFYNRLPIHPPSLPGDPRGTEALLDHRGLIYLKHGAPFADFAPPLSSELEPERDLASSGGDPKGQEGPRLAASMARTEIWVYWFEGAWRTLTFRGSDALGRNAATTLSSYLPPQNAGAWLSLAAMLPEYQAAANEVNGYHGVQPVACLANVHNAIVHHRADAEVGIDTDSDTPPITAPWNATVRFFGLGHGDDGTNRALITFALPLDQMRGDSLADGHVSRQARFRIVAYRPLDGASIALDTTRTFVTTNAPTGGFVTSWFEIPLQPGSWQIAVRVRQPADTADHLYALRRKLVIDGAPTLSLSDVVLGTAGNAAWRAPDGPFPVNTLGTWPRGSDAELWYEVRGLRTGDAYTTTITVTPTGKNSDREITVTTNDRATGPVTAVRRSLGLDRLTTGRYLLTLTVTAHGTSAMREQDVVVVDEK